ncbi:MAG: hypothetical protein HYY05_01850 [Chloroflexi bacterium]|nr:hypothetical protein [Chloroflexota bacterium]
MLHRPPRWPGLPVGLGLALLTVGVAVFSLSRLPDREISLSVFGWSLAAAAAAVLALRLLVQSFGCWNLSYQLSRNGLRIRWGPETHVIPVHQISDVCEGREVGESLRVRGVLWPGHYVGRARTRLFGEVTCFATRREPEAVLFVVTSAMTYAISPADPLRFLQDYRVRRQLGPTRRWFPEVLRWPLLDHAIYRDRLALGLGLGAMLCNSFLFGYLSYRYPTLPQLVPLQLTPTGQQAVIGLRSDLFQLPLWGLAVLGLNLVLALALYQRDRVAAILLLSGGTAMQLVLAAAVARLLN